MGEEKETGKQPISKDTIFKVMLYITYIVSGVFLLKNIVGKNLPGMVAIGLRGMVQRNQPLTAFLAAMRAKVALRPAAQPASRFG